MAWLSSHINPKHSQKTVNGGVQYLEILQPELCHGADFSVVLLVGTRLPRYSDTGSWANFYSAEWNLYRSSSVAQLRDPKYTTAATQLKDPNTQLLVHNWSSSSKVLFICNLGVK